MPVRSLPSSIVFATLALTACKGADTTKPAAATASVASAAAPGTPPAAGASIHGVTMKRLDGSDVTLSSFAGKVLLVVNTASECGYTPQYEGLEKLHQRYEPKGFSVLGFPSNDFGGQEPGTSEQIATFCKSRYGVSFPMFAKVKTTGDGRAPLYTTLASALGEPKWNFHKYLVDKRGAPVRAFPSAVTPEASELVAAIEAELARP